MRLNNVTNKLLDFYFQEKELFPEGLKIGQGYYICKWTRAQYEEILDNTAPVDIQNFLYIIPVYHNIVAKNAIIDFVVSRKEVNL